jgi:hypothetical protein
MLTVLPFSIAMTLALCVAREMFRRQGEVGMATAIGRLHIAILVLLPVATVLGLLFVAPGYLQSMAAANAGRLALSGPVCAQIAINLSLRKAIDVSIHRLCIVRS